MTTIKQISDYAAASSIARTDRFLLQQGADGVLYTYGTPAQMFACMLSADVTTALGYTPVADIVIGSGAFINAGTITNGGTVTQAALSNDFGSASGTISLASTIASGHTWTGINNFSTLQLNGSTVATASQITWNGGSVAAIDGVTLINSGGTLEVGTIVYSNLPASAQHRTLEFAIVGQPGASQVYQIVLTEAGTLVANSGGAQGNVLTDPTATWDFVLATEHSGTVTTQGTVAISTAGSITFPSFSAVTLAAGDSVRITSQATPDATGSDLALAFRYLVT